MTRFRGRRGGKPVQTEQMRLADSLVGRWVVFAHRPPGVPPALVVARDPDGMIELLGWSGLFAPSGFVLATDKEMQGKERR